MNSLMLAQLMKDLQDPEMMREAQKMMNDPAFQAQMKKITESPAFKQQMKAQQEMLKDPKKVKELEKKVQIKLKEGTEMLEKLKSERSAQEVATGGDQQDDNIKKGDKDCEEKNSVTEKKNEEEDEMPDIPNLNLN